MTAINCPLGAKRMMLLDAGGARFDFGRWLRDGDKSRGARALGESHFRKGSGDSNTGWIYAEMMPVFVLLDATMDNRRDVLNLGCPGEARKARL